MPNSVWLVAVVAAISIAVSLYFTQTSPSLCGDGIVQNAASTADGSEECDDGNNEDGDGCSSVCKVEASCDIQLFNLQYPNDERNEVNDNLYLQDLAEYNADPLAFLSGRAAACGGGTSNFASLGKLILGEYEDIDKIIQSPQVRGFFLGRGRLNPDRLTPNFMLSLDDPGTDTEDGQTGIHQILHDFVWFDTIGKAQARIDTDENTKAALDSYISRLISELQEAGTEGPAVTMALSEQFTCRYMMKALFDIDIDDETVASLQMLWQTPGAVLGSIFDPSPVTPAEYSGIEALLDDLSLVIQNSPALADYEPSEANYNLSRKEWADELIPVVGIAALGGGRNLINNLFTEIPSDYVIEATNHQEVTAAVLEAGRIRAPVNNINVILQEPTTFNVGGEAKTFPEGTVVAASIGLGSVDPKTFPNPDTFDHTRDNLMSQILNYNSVGFDPEAVGTRVCPGRNIALKMGMDVLKAWLQRDGSEAEDNEDSDTAFRAEFVDPDYWHPPSRNFEIIDWEKWEACDPQIPYVLDPPQKYNTAFDNIFDGFWGRNGNLPDDVIATGEKPMVGNVSDPDLGLFHGILGPHPDSSVVPEVFRNKLLWMQGNQMFEYLLSLNRAAWRPNTEEGRVIGLVSTGYDWSYATHARGMFGADLLKDAFLNIQMSPDGKWVKLFQINQDDPSDPDLDGAWIDMYIVQEGDEFYDTEGNVQDWLKPGDIYRLTWEGRSDPYMCDADKISFAYMARVVATLDEETGEITPESPDYDELIKTVLSQPPKEVEEATNGFTTSESMTEEEKYDFLFAYEPDRQMYLSSPPPPYGDALENLEPAFLDPDYWHPKSRNFEIIDWEKWEACNPQIPYVFDPPQRYTGGFGDIFNFTGQLWGRSYLTASDEQVAAGPMPQIGHVSDPDLGLFYGILGPHPDSSVIPEIFRNKLLWMQDNDAPEYLLSFNRAAWRPNTEEGRVIGLVSMSDDWTWAPTPNALYATNDLPSFNIQMSPNGKWVKLFRISDDPSDPDLANAWIDMYIVQEGDVFYDTEDNVLDWIKPGDIYRLTWHNQGDPYLCDADEISFAYFARVVATLDEETGEITPESPAYDELIKAVLSQPPKEVEEATNGFTNSESMTEEEKHDFLVTYEPDRQMYKSASEPPYGDAIENL